MNETDKHSKKKKNPTLIVLPKSLVFNWESELAKLNPNLKFYTYYGPERDIKNIKVKITFTIQVMIKIAFLCFTFS